MAVVPIAPAAPLNRQCPLCSAAARFLEFTSVCNDGNYFQCTGCKYVWREPKEEGRSLPAPIRPPANAC
jgi:rubredoxin